MYYIAYGSNMNLEQMSWRCPDAKRYGNGTLKGWKLVFNLHADIEETGEPFDEVPVVIWELNGSDEKSLDRYEGYPRYYVKETVEAETDDGCVIEGMVYVMAENRKGINPPGEEYFETIKTGYMENGIDTAPLYAALNESMLL